ncbi:MAG: HAD family hydrolase [Prolixibacteraceae bacterium]
MKDISYQIETQKSPLGDRGVLGLIKAIIFDLDGTLLDSIADIALANNKVLAGNNLPVHSVENYIEYIGNGARKLVQLALPADLAADESQVNLFLAAYKKEYLQHIVVESKLYDGIPELLNFLNEQEIPFAINTNKPHDQTMLIANHLLKDFKVKSILGQKDNNPKKPDPFGALKIAEELNHTPSDILFVGDSDVDIKTALAAGMSAVGVTWGYGKQSEMAEAGCKVFVKDAFELKTLIEKRRVLNLSK